MKTLPKLIYNDDSCTLRMIRPPHVPEQIALATDYLRDTQVGRICWCFYETALAFSWKSNHLQCFTDLVRRADNEFSQYAKFNWIMSMEDRHIDYVPLLIERFHRQNQEFYASFRMNDCHLKSEPHGAMVTDFWRDNQDKRLWSVTEAFSYYNAGMDYSFAEVRDLHYGAIDEIVSRYDVDGVELDFLRNEFAFQVDEAWEKRAILTDFIRRIRKRLAQGNVNGRPVGLMIRIPAESAKQQRGGFDVAAWCQEGLVDLIVAGARANDMNISLAPLAAICKENHIPLYGDIEINPAINPAPQTQITPDQTIVQHNYNYNTDIFERVENSCAQAEILLSQGVDGLYLFNFPCWRAETVGGMYESAKRTPKELAAFDQLLKSAGTLQTLAPLPRKYFAWTMLPIYVEALRPARYHQTLQLNLGTKLGDGETLEISFRVYAAPNPHAYHPESSDQMQELLKVYADNKVIAPEAIKITCHPHSQIPSGYTIGAHQQWQFTLSQAPAVLSLAFHMPQYPGDNTPYLYIHDLQLTKRPRH